MAKNQYLASELEGLAVFTDYDGANSDSDKWDRFLALIEAEHTQEQRGHLDQISPAAHRQLLVELYELKNQLAGGLNPDQAIVQSGQTYELDATPDAIEATVTGGVVTFTTA